MWLIAGVLGALPVAAAPDGGMLQKALLGRGDRFIEAPVSASNAYIANSSAQTMTFGSGGIDVRPRGALAASAKASPAPTLRYEFASAASVAPAGVKDSGITYNWFVGTRANWATNLKSYSQVSYRGLWPGIDATYSGDASGIKYHFDVAAGADAKAVRFIVRGATDARVTADGAVEWTVGGALVRDEVPVAYQSIGGQDRIVSAAFRLEPIDAATWSLAIDVADHDKSKALTVDPAWNAFAGLVGGNASDQVYSVARDSQGNTYACGVTASSNLPTLAAFDTSSNGGDDAFLVKFNSSGVPAFVTYFGGSGYDVCTGIAVHTDGTIYVAGGTTSTNFPFQGTDVNGRFNRTKSGSDRDAFVAKFASAGNVLVYSGVLGGASDDQANAIALDTSGRAHVAGYTKSTGFPAFNGPAGSLNGVMDAFVARIAADGSGVDYSGFVGGNGDVEAARGIAVAADGTAYVVGETNSTSGLPGTSGTVRTLAGGGADGFVTKINSNGSLAWLTLLAGTSASSSGIDRALAVAIDPADGNLLVAGETDSNNFPANDAGTRLGGLGPQNAIVGGMDGFLVRMSPDGTSILGATYLGGAAFDSAEGVAADGQGAIYVTGTTGFDAASTFPTLSTGGLSTTRLGAQDGFLAKLSAGPPLSLSYSGFVGSSGSSVDDSMHALAATPGVSSVLSLGGSTSGLAAGFTNGTSGALGGGASVNGVVLSVNPFHAPLTISVFTGTPQSASIGTSFAQNLTVRITDADASPVAGFAVTFVAPASSTASATLSPAIPVVTDAGGMAHVSAVADAISGTYTVHATASGVSGTASFQLTNTQLTQTISFGALGGKTFGDAPFAVSATATSGLTVTFSSTTLPVCSVSGNTVTIVAAGNCTIAADQAGNASFAPAAQVTQTFSVAKASQTIAFPTVAAQTYSVGGTFGVSATASSGLTVTFSSTTLSVCTVSGTTATMVTTGTCTIAADQAGNASYNAAPQVTQNIAISPAAGHGRSFDFDGDGKGDLLWQNTDGRIVAWLMDGIVSTATGRIIGKATGWSVAKVADLDGDGKSDLILQNVDGRVEILLMNGTAATSTVQILNSGTGFSVAHAADLNGDGKADIVWQNTDGSVAVWLMNGTTLISGATIMGPGTGWSVTRIADFDGDGRADLLWTHTDGRVAIWLMNGTSVKSSTEILGPGTGWSALQTPDLNGDGKADIIWQKTDGSVAAWTMDGASVTSGAGLLGSGTGWSVTQAVDFDGDGKSDLVWRHTDGRVAIWLMNGIVPTVTTEIMAAGSGWSVKRAADLNGDGKADIIWQHTDGTAAVWLMNGTALVSGNTILGPASGFSVLAPDP